MNDRVAGRGRAMLELAVKLTTKPWTIAQADRAHLRAAAFSDRDICDISAAAAFCHMTQQLAPAPAMGPSCEYPRLARQLR